MVQSVDVTPVFLRVFDQKEFRVHRWHTESLWWCAADVCDYLGVQHVGSALRRLEPTDKIRLYVQGSQGRVHPLVFLSELGVLSLALGNRSDKGTFLARWFLSHIIASRSITVPAPRQLTGDTLPLNSDAKPPSVALSVPSAPPMPVVLNERFDTLERGMSLIADILGTRLRGIDQTVTSSMERVVSKVSVSFDSIEALVAGFDNKLQQDIYTARDEARTLAAENARAEALSEEREFDKVRLISQADAQLQSSKQYAKHLIDEVAALKAHVEELEKSLHTWKKRARSWGRALYKRDADAAGDDEALWLLVNDRLN